MAIRFLGEKPTPTRTTETRAVKNWQSFAELFDEPDQSDAEKLDGFAESWRQVIRASRARITAGRCGG